SSEENLIITTGQDNTVRFWNIEDGTQNGPALEYKGSVQVAFIIPNTGRIFTKDEDGSTWIWDRKTGQRLGHEVILGASSERVPFRSDGKELLTIENNNLFIWNVLQNNLKLNTSLTTDELTNPAFTPGVRKIVIADTINNTLVFQLLNSKTRSQIGQNMKVGKKLSNDEMNNIIQHGFKIFSPDGRKLVTEISPTTMLIWDVDNQKQIGNKEIPWKKTEFVYSVNTGLPVFSPDSKIIAVLIDSQINFINAETGARYGKEIPFIHSPEDLIDLHIVFSPDNTKILTHKYYVYPKKENIDGADTIDILTSEINLWNIQTGKQIGKEIKYQRKIDPDFFSELIEGIGIDLVSGPKRTVGNVPPVFNPDGKSFLTSFTYNSTCQIWDAASGKQIGNIVVLKSKWAPFFSADGSSILAAVNDSTIGYFDARTGKQKQDPIK